MNFLVLVATSVATYALFSLGLNLQWGFTGLINFGHVAFMAIGAYTTVLLSMAGVPLILAAIVGAILAALLGLLIGLSTLRLREDYLAIVTIGVSELVRLVAQNEEWLTKGSFGVQGYPLPLSNSVGLMILSVLTVALVFWLLERLVRSPWGRVLKAIREDEQIPKALGKNIFWYKLQAFMLGGAIAGIAGSFNAWYLTTVYPNNFEPLITFNAWTIVVLGGAGNNVGTLIGAVLFSTYYEITRFVLPAIIPLDTARLAAFRIMIIGLILIILMMWRPQGMLGKKEELTLGR
ncbi:branched-chain amino acid ABC transporter permease [Microcoleus sp. FACHB-831]|uniref:branched-chain amino acid ABC transporter permease n=1 Tax=Microcoleus sp. FACHB-831 TaxID=2692827 RepID=UPI0016884E51|nr:branched-chain amino acid ABC transporter permease [Microcoleus sp. FACHB-831]MBD1924441.1 branched-chain amino acid ABC transporter permease [Microcoleus sp. FACHB-831]